jgi:O-antigen/teichoic acid export membrane protein
MIATYVNKLKGKKFTFDVFVNMISYLLIGGIGVIVNYIILKAYNVAAIGYFNKMWALYVLFAQLSVGGIHLSVQRYIPEHAADKTKSSVILSSAVSLTLLVSTFCSLVAWALSVPISSIMGDENIRYSLILMLPGLVFFSLNKVLLAYINGLRYMQSFAVFNSLRLILMLISLAVIIFLKFDYTFLPVVFSCSELPLFVIMSIYLLKHWSIGKWPEYRSWFRLHRLFGARVVIGHFLLDVNTRVDVLILSPFCTDKIVGIYSFASNIAEGFGQLPFVLRTVINPIITVAYMKKNKFLLERIIRKSVRLYYKYFSLLGLALILGYFAFIHLFQVSEQLSGSWAVMAILVGGIVGGSGYLPFMLIFNQIGMPSMQTFFLMLYFLTNVVLNLILIPFLGMYGAATATAITYILQIFYLKYLLKRKTSIHI